MVHTPPDMSSLQRPSPAHDGAPNTASTGDQPNGSPLAEHHYLQIETCASRMKRVRKGASYASFSGSSTLMAGAIALPFSLGSGAMLALALALCALGYNELTLRRPLLRLQPGAARGLALNQVALGGVLIAYAVWQLSTGGASGMFATAAPDPQLEALLADPAVAQSAPQLAGLTTKMDNLAQLISLAVYGGLIVFAVVFQGSAALFYLARGRQVRHVLRHTPMWIIELHRRGAFA